MARLKSLGAALSLALAATTPLALGQNDRINDEPTGWWYGYSSSEAAIDTAIGNNQRPFNFTHTSGNYDVLYVQNSGEYAATGTDALWAVSTSTISTNAALSNNRILDLEPVDPALGTWSAIMVDNSGVTAAPGWNWETGLTFAGLINWQSANGLRPIDVDTYTTPVGTRYSIVGVPNTGNNQQGWWWYFGVTSAQITSALTTNGARLIDIDIADTSPLTFNVVMVSQNTGGGWWHPELTSGQVSDLLNQTAGRLTCLQRYTNAGGSTRFAVAVVDNANAQTRRLRQILFDGTGDNAATGVYLKEVGGPVLVSLNATREFEPASMLKILYHAYAIDRCASNLDELDNQVFTNDRCNNNECPVGSADCNAGNEDLSNVLREMMEQSDNPRTYEVETRYGRANLNAFATALGCTGTQINHSIGCGNGSGTIPNTLTLQDAGIIYESIADGTLFSQAWQDIAYELMNDIDSQGFDEFTLAMINAEAALTNLTAAEVSSWKAAFNMVQKRGGYGVSHTGGQPTPGGPTCCVYHYTRGGWASVPFKTTQGIVFNKEYVLADFVNNEYIEQDAVDTDRACFFDIIREQVRQGLQSWDAACSTPVITNEPDNTTATEGDDVALSVVAVSTGTRTYQWQKQVGPNWFNLSNANGTITGVTTPTMTLLDVDSGDNGLFRCLVLTICGLDTSASALVTVNPPTSGCDTVDFNRDGLFPDVQDISDFIAVFGGAPCPTGTGQCGDIDFNNDGLFPDIADIESLIRVFGGGPCL